MLVKIALLVTLAVVSSHAQSKVPVYVYYESLCPDSAKFINEQLYPTVKQFRDNIDLKLIPFGKSSYRTQGSETLFECHHGPNECYGNKVHACGLANIEGNSYQPNNTKEALTLEYVNCLMERAQFKSGEFPGKVCADQIEVNWDIIEQCANSTKGSELLKNYGEATKQLQNPLLSVPTVAFRQTYDSDAQKLAVDNFRAALCKNLSPTPSECRVGPSGGVSAVASFGLLTVASLILTRLF